MLPLALSFLYLLGGLAGAARANGEAPELELLGVIEARYREVRDLRADFEQESTIASIGRVDRSRGSVLVQRPGRMRWEYREPEPRVIAIDGEALRIYTPGDRQLQIASLAGGGLSPTALDFLLGRGDLRRDFLAEPLTDDARAERGFRLRPRVEAGFEYLELWVRPKTGELRESVLVDLFGNRTRIRFEDLQENTGVADDAFTIAVPEGTDVIDLR